jgi:hypothetical protein
MDQIFAMFPRFSTDSVSFSSSHEESREEESVNSVNSVADPQPLVA